jgi:phosphatidylglycerol:prolipoprotein diacylglycerol transferase
MIAFPSIDPVAISLGPLKVHWYGLMYLLAFASAWWLGKRRARLEWTPVKTEQVDDLIFYGAIGAVLGGRIGSVIFYNFDSFLAGGNGNFPTQDRLPLFFRVDRFYCAAGAAGACRRAFRQFHQRRTLGCARQCTLGDEAILRAVSTGLEGLLLFGVLWLLSARPRPVMTISGYFLLLYGLARSAVELIRLPDAHIGYLLNTDWLTRGIVLSVPMIIVGLILLVLAKRSQNAAIS